MVVVAGWRTLSAVVCVCLLSADFPLDRVPVVLSPLLYQGQSDITEDRLVATNISQPSFVVRMGGLGYGEEWYS